MIRGHFASILSLVKKTLGILEEFVARATNLITKSSQELLEIFETQLKRLEAQAVGVRQVQPASTFGPSEDLTEEAVNRSRRLGYFAFTPNYSESLVDT